MEFEEAELTGPELEEREPEPVCALVTLAQPARLVQMADRAFDDPAFAAKPRAVLCAAPGDDRDDPAGAELAAVLVVVIAAVGEDAVGLATRPADLSHDRVLAAQIDQRQKLGDIVTVPGADADRQQNAPRVSQRVGFDAILRAIDRRGAGEVPPKTARWEEPSTTPVLQSISPWAFSSARSRSCN